MLMRSSVVPRGTWTESIGIPREVRAAPPGRTHVRALMPPSEHGGKHLEHDPEKLQTFRTRSCSRSETLERYPGEAAPLRGIAVGAFQVRFASPRYRARAGG